MVEFYDPSKDPRKNINWMSPLDPGAGGVIYRGQEDNKLDYTKEPEVPRGVLDSSGNVIEPTSPISSPIVVKVPAYASGSTIQGKTLIQPYIKLPGSPIGTIAKKGEGNIGYWETPPHTTSKQELANYFNAVYEQEQKQVSYYRSLVEPEKKYIYKGRETSGGKILKEYDTIAQDIFNAKSETSRSISQAPEDLRFYRNKKGEFDPFYTPEYFKKQVGSEAWERQVSLVAVSEQEKRVTQPGTLIPGFKFNLFGKELGWGEVKQPQWMANLNVSTVSVYDIPKAEQILTSTYAKGKDTWSILEPRTKWGYSWATSEISAVAWPITLPQALIKWGTGGKTLLLPDVAEEISKRTYIPGMPSGLLSTGISEGIGKLTGTESNAFETYQKDVWSGAFATGGEILGLQIGSMGAHAVKVGAIKGLGKVRSGLQSITGWNIPGYTKIMYYTPQRIIRRAWVKGVGKTEIASDMGIGFHSLETLDTGGLSFAPGGSTGARITWTLGKTKATKDLLYSGDEYLLGSSGASNIGFSYTIKGQALHELPSMSYTPYGYAPTRFFRFTPSGLNYSSSPSLFPKIWRPTGLVTKIKELYSAPSGSYASISKWGLEQPKGSWGVLGPKMVKGGSEIELNVFGSKWYSIGNRSILKRYLPAPEKASTLQRLFGYQYYADVPLEGGLTEVVPVKFTTLKGVGKPSGVKLLLGKGKDFFSSSSVSPSISYASAVNPFTVFGLASLSKVRSSSMISPSKGYSYSPSISKSLVSGLSSRLGSRGYSSPSSLFSSGAPSISYPSKPSSPSKPSVSSYFSVSKPSYPSSPPSSPSISVPPYYPSRGYSGIGYYPRKKHKRKSEDYGFGKQIRIWKIKGFDELFTEIAPKRKKKKKRWEL